MSPFMKYINGVLGLTPTSRRKVDSRKWSQDFLDHVDKQYTLWEGVYDRLAGTNRLLGAAEMTTYSEDEREQLDILLQNMEEFAPRIGGDRGRKIARLHSMTREALREYDSYVESALHDRTL